MRNGLRAIWTEPSRFLPSELADTLHAEVHDALRQLRIQGRLRHMDFNGQLLYTSADLPAHRRQLRTRQTGEAVPVAADVISLQVSPHELQTAILLFYSLLDEQQRRLYAGLESIRLGRGGDALIADFLALDPTHGRTRTSAVARSRCGYRWYSPPRWWANPNGKKTPAIIACLEDLLEDDTAGDPITGLKWSRRTTAKIAEALSGYGICVSTNTVARLRTIWITPSASTLRRCRPNPAPDRNLQFDYIADLRDRFRRRRLPIISVDTKKRELVGNFNNPGACWRQSPRLVYDHDFCSDSIGVAIPYGIYDTVANRGSIVVGVSHNTPAFAARAIARWWRHEGHADYSGSRQLLILADTGGSNGYRCRAWKTQLQSQLADGFHLHVTVAHYPTGTSKWNPIEHRLFSEISKNWAGEPLDSYQKILNFIRTTSHTQWPRCFCLPGSTPLPYWRRTHCCRTSTSPTPTSRYAAEMELHYQAESGLICCAVIFAPPLSEVSAKKAKPAA